MVDLENKIIEFVSSILDFLKGLNDAHLDSFLSHWPSTPCRMRPLVANALPILAWMPAAVKAANKQTELMVRTLASLSNQLAWGQTYSALDFGAGFLERYGWTELIGLRGPIASDRMACGLLFLGPETEYPRHRHEADEIYVPLTGPTLWQRSDQEWAYRAPGRPIYHASGLPHAMRTQTVPLVALYLWRGDNLIQKSRIE